MKGSLMYSLNLLHWCYFFDQILMSVAITPITAILMLPVSMVLEAFSVSVLKDSREMG